MDEAERLARHMMRAEHGEKPPYPTDDILRHYLRYAHLALAAMKDIKKEGALQAPN